MAKSKQPRDANRAHHARLIDYQRTFGSIPGKRVLKDLIDSNFLLQPTYSGDAEQALVHEGQRNAVLRILTFLKADPAEFLQFIEEIENNARSSDD